MEKRRLTLSRETLGTLEQDELASVAGAVSIPHPNCLVTSYNLTYCNTCGLGCTYRCGETS